MGDIRSLRKHILAETRKAREEADRRVDNVKETSVGCIDEKSVNSREMEWRPAGGWAFMVLEGKGDDYVEKRKGKGITAVAHKRCAYLYFVHGAQTLERQKEILQSIDDKTKELREKYGSDIEFIIDPDGSAPI